MAFTYNGVGIGSKKQKDPYEKHHIWPTISRMIAFMKDMMEGNGLIMLEKSWIYWIIKA